MAALDIQKGKFLFADPFLHDPYFKRTVILLVEHNDHGSVGFIMNKRLEIKLDSLLADPLLMDTEVYYGGPVNTNSLYYLHKKGSLIEDSVEVGNGYYWGGNFETICSLIRSEVLSPNDIKFFVGYSSWGRDQLLEELQEKAWIVGEADIDWVFSDEKEAWRKKMTDLGDDYAIWANFPENPSLN